MTAAPIRRLTLVAVVLGGFALGCTPAPTVPPAATTKPADHDDHDDHDHDHDRPAPAPKQPADTAKAAAKPAADDHDHDDAAKKDADHDHADHDHPKTLAEGVAALGKAAAAVKDHLAADARDKADDAVHDLGHLLEDVQGLVGTSDLAADAKKAATAALDDLFDCFDKLDTALHAEPGKGDSPAEVHASLAERVEAAIKALTDATAKPAAAPAAAATDDDDEAAAIIRSAKKAEGDR